MRSRNVVLTAGFLALIVAVTAVCGALGLLTNPGQGWSGAAEGALVGIGAALAVLVVHGVRVIFSRTPEATGPAHHPESVERHYLKEAASGAFADTLVLLGLATLGSFSILQGVDMRVVLVALFLTAAGDCAIRFSMLKKRGH